MIKKRYTAFLATRSAKRIGLLALLLLSFYLLYERKYGYEHFLIEDVRQPAFFTYEKDVRSRSYSQIKVHVTGEIKGRASVSVDACNDINSTNHYYTPRLKVVITGKVDTVMATQYYIGQACIKYRPRTAESGKLSIAVSIR
ncbi:hypothetical protein SAMN06269250_3791 [Spirosoma fluviale]|uniref:Uncharacterized protein n=1 Tax=Spirosoma fluviale TaxID=1597977 RepID=A0A286G931_9BACT|nr:hypothetical protein SAMN06269250_3791 [Spirosoma fluviale]